MSKIIAIMPCRNSAWVLGMSARALLMWVDAIVIQDHRVPDSPIDETWDIMTQLMAQYGYERVIRATAISAQWEEMQHRQWLLERARQERATHIVTIDDDEVLAANLLPTIRKYIEATPAGSVLQIPWLCMRGGHDQVQTGGIWGDQDVSIAFLDAPECHWAARDGYDFHHRHPMGRAQVPYKPLHTRGAGLMHLQFSSERRLKAKQALYKMTEVLRWPGRDTLADINTRYDLAVHGCYPGSQYDPHVLDSRQAPAEWWAGYEHLMGFLDLEAEPWQEAEARRLWAEGPERFEGLDLFGVVG